jgi:hypothetical protein
MLFDHIDRVLSHIIPMAPTVSAEPGTFHTAEQAHFHNPSKPPPSNRILSDFEVYEARQLCAPGFN